MKSRRCGLENSGRQRITPLPADLSLREEIADIGPGSEYAASLVPKIMGQTAAAMDPHAREVDSTLDAIKSQIPVMRESCGPYAMHSAIRSPLIACSPWSRLLHAMRRRARWGPKPNAWPCRSQERLRASSYPRPAIEN